MPAKFLAALAGNFPVIPKGYHGVVYVLLGTRHIGGIMVELWGSMGKYGGIMGNFGCHFLCCWSLFVLVVWPLDSTDVSDFHPHDNVLYVRLSDLYKAIGEYMS